MKRSVRAGCNHDIQSLLKKGYLFRQSFSSAGETERIKPGVIPNSLGTERPCNKSAILVINMRSQKERDRRGLKTNLYSRSSTISVGGQGGGSWEENKANSFF